VCCIAASSRVPCNTRDALWAGSYEGMRGRAAAAPGAWPRALRRWRRCDAVQCHWTLGPPNGTLSTSTWTQGRQYVDFAVRLTPFPP
jgi:hypothetical protein